MIKRSGTGGFWAVLLKLMLSLTAAGYVAWRIYDANIDWQSIPGTFGAGSFALLLAVIAGMGLNITAEAAKWRLLVKPFYPAVSLLTAVEATLAGLATGIFTPNRIGEYFGRAWFLKPGKRPEVIFATFLDRIIQMSVTVIFGLASLIYLQQTYGFDQPDLLNDSLRYVFITSGILLALILIVFLRPKKLIDFIQKQKLRKWLGRFKRAYTVVPNKTLARVFLLAVGRYLVFTGQFVLLIYAFGESGGFFLFFSLVSAVFLLKSVFPILGIFEIGVREAIALMIFPLFGISDFTSVTATFLLYAINIILPTLAGVFFLFRLKLEGERT